MRMLTLALLLASATSVPAFAEPGEPDEARSSAPLSGTVLRQRFGGRDSGGGVQVIDEGRAARFEAMAQARAARAQQSQQQQAPTPPVHTDGGNWGGRHNRGNEGMRTGPNSQTLPRNRGWQGGDDGRHSHRDHDADRRRWSNHDQNAQPGPIPAPNTSSVFDRHGDSRRDRPFDRNNNGRVDRRWDHDRNGRLDRRWDHDGDERLDHRWDRNGNGRIDQRWRDGNRWNHGWRNDRRYDWRGYRNHYRHQYRQPRYYNPYGYRYGYQRFGIGIYLDRLFFGNRYWLSDPWEYRLPPAPYGYRWVRYYDDVLLVDTRNGYVVDAIYGFFW